MSGQSLRGQSRVTAYRVSAATIAAPPIARQAQSPFSLGQSQAAAISIETPMQFRISTRSMFTGEPPPRR